MSATGPYDDPMFVEERDVRDVHSGRLAVRGRAANVAVVMMQRDEDRMLDPWLRYHAHVFGAGNLHVLDNGSSLPGVRERLERAAAEGVRIVTDYAGPEHAANRGVLIGGLLRELEAEGFDFLMPLECNAFVAHQAPDGRVGCGPDTVLGHLNADHKDDPRLLLIRGAYLNVPGQPGFYFFKNQRRCFFARGSVGGLDAGLHRGASRRSPEEVLTALVHVHYRFPPYTLLDDAARAALDALRDTAAAEGLKGFKGKAEGMSFAAADEAQYHAFFRRFDRVPLASLKMALKRRGCSLPD